jgi:hypothetical protein
MVQGWNPREPRVMVQGRRDHLVWRPIIFLEPLSALALLALWGKDPLLSRDRGRLSGAKFVVASRLDRDLPKAAARLAMAYHMPQSPAHPL